MSLNSGQITLKVGRTKFACLVGLEDFIVFWLSVPFVASLSAFDPVIWASIKAESEVKPQTKLKMYFPFFLFAIAPL